ncbi:anti-sigma factor domain-containing protein [Undibacterium arcticum]|uniref:Anti-sigma factor domain-containing protein n=1 Tax=Undibacterium arcticum TaxID=1762892 RepID=A0ABV7F334_9BURK
MNISDNDSLLEQLAAEYVLGTLKGGARRRLETAMQDNPLLRRAVAEWQDRLHPLAELAPGAQPSPQVWRHLEQQLNLQHLAAVQRKRAFWLSLHNDLSFWRGLGMASTALATILVTVLLTRQLEPITPITSYVATLADDKAQPAMIIIGDAKRRQLTVKVLTAQAIAADKSLELWAVPKDGAPRSLGLVAANGTVTLPLPDNATPHTIALLAITLEPKGGSPNPNRPSGPIVFKGAWVQL